MQNKTYSESNKYYAVVWINGQSYYKGPYNTRSAARRIAIREQAKVNQARNMGFIYNPKYTS